MNGPDEQMALLPPAVGTKPSIECVPAHEVELIEPDGFGYRFVRGFGWIVVPPWDDEFLRGRP